MAWIPFYADDDDFVSITERLNADKEIAFIRPCGGDTWIAKNRINRLCSGEYRLWHILGGDIRQYSEGKRKVFTGALRQLFKAPKGMIEAAGTVANPYDGWKGPHVSAKKDVPFLANEPNIIELVVNITGLKNTSAIGMSCFGWIANRYRAVGSPAHKRTVNWWNSLKRWMAAQSAARISRFGPLDKHPEIWVFPCALIKINGGKDREANAL